MPNGLPGRIPLQVKQVESDGKLIQMWATSSIASNESIQLASNPVYSQTGQTSSETSCNNGSGGTGSSSDKSQKGDSGGVSQWIDTAYIGPGVFSKKADVMRNFVEQWQWGHMHSQGDAAGDIGDSGLGSVGSGSDPERSVGSGSDPERSSWDIGAPSSDYALASSSSVGAGSGKGLFLSLVCDLVVSHVCHATFL